MKLQQILEARYATKGNSFVVSWPHYQEDNVYKYTGGETLAEPGIYSREEQLAVVHSTKQKALEELAEVLMHDDQSGEYWDYDLSDISINQLLRKANVQQQLIDQIGRDLENRDDWLNVYPLGTRDFY
jgi:hypothetical protein